MYIYIYIFIYFYIYRDVNITKIEYGMIYRLIYFATHGIISDMFYVILAEEHYGIFSIIGHITWSGIWFM